MLQTISHNPASNAIGELLSVDPTNGNQPSKVPNGQMPGTSNSGSGNQIRQPISNQDLDVRDRLSKEPPSCEPSATFVPGQGKICKDQLIFEESFTLGKLDRTKWKHDCHMANIDMDNEFVSYQAKPENIFVSDKSLMFHPTVLNDADFVESGELDLASTCGCAPMAYGECSRKAMFYNILPPVVSAILNLEPKDYNHGSGYKSGAMRIAFARGNKVLKSQETDYDFGSSELSGALLFKHDDPVRNITAKVYKNVNKESWANAFHKYELEWTPYHVCFIVDNIKYGVILPPKGNFPSGQSQDVTKGENWKNHMPMFSELMVVRLGLGAGGITDFPDGTSSSSSNGDFAPKPWENFNPKSMLR
ncbi:beta-1,3-glucan-binding protein-like [Ctenocephalides felis]|uniref:beta-1,3-glucan-binding protein-like n=1 Tax=Ctenocephalides felis TaxID=7515 RepID=UPI000E6E3FB5|nr:beta-1,3-glucan-binding protein-like [Ctenocephalides felis]